jgi:hypothetical protein
MSQVQTGSMYEGERETQEQKEEEKQINKEKRN